MKEPRHPNEPSLKQLISYRNSILTLKQREALESQIARAVVRDEKAE